MTPVGTAEEEEVGSQTGGSKEGCQWNANPRTGTELMLPSSVQGGGRGGQWFARPETGLYRCCHHPYREVRRIMPVIQRIGREG